MRLSEAIRLGATMKPQGFSQWDDNTCALKAASEAVGIKHQYMANRGYHPNYGEIREMWPYINMDSSCPLCRENGDLIFSIYHLNDSHKWSREKIADFVEMVELEKGEIMNEKELVEVEELEPITAPQSTAGFLE